MNQQDPMTMEEYLKMMGLGSENQGIDDAVKMQMEQARAMRPDAPQLREAGRTVVAPGILETLGKLAQSGVSNSLMNKSVQGMAQKRANAMTQNEMLMRAIMGQQPPQPVQNAAPGQMTPGMPPAQGLNMQARRPAVPFGFNAPGGYEDQ